MKIDYTPPLSVLPQLENRGGRAKELFRIVDFFTCWRSVVVCVGLDGWTDGRMAGRRDGWENVAPQGALPASVRDPVDFPLSVTGLQASPASGTRSGFKTFLQNWT